MEKATMLLVLPVCLISHEIPHTINGKLCIRKPMMHMVIRFSNVEPAVAPPPLSCLSTSNKLKNIVVMHRSIAFVIISLGNAVFLL